MNPEQLLTPAVIDALGGWDSRDARVGTDALNICAPLIAAQALRLLAREVDGDTLHYETYLLLNGCADEWEGK